MTNHCTLTDLYPDAEVAINCGQRIFNPPQMTGAQYALGKLAKDLRMCNVYAHLIRRTGVCRFEIVRESSAYPEHCYLAGWPARAV